MLNQNEWIKVSGNFCEQCVNNINRGNNIGIGCPIDDMRMECSESRTFKKIAAKYLSGNAYDFKQCSMFLAKKSSAIVGK